MRRDEEAMSPRERSIRLYAHEVRGVLSGRQTQTRRVIRGDHTKVFWHPIVVKGYGGWVNEHGRPVPCPFGVPGDRLWVRETWAEGWTYGGGNAVVWYRADAQARFKQRPDVVCDYAPLPDQVKWRPSIHMPRWASRITLEITEMRVQRLQEISEEDALAEGVIGIYAHARTNPRGAFHALWGSINGPGSWDANPWVWAITFRRMA